MYWRKLFDRENPNEKLEQKILDIRKKNKDFGSYYVRLFYIENLSLTDTFSISFFLFLIL